jgi:hypothetical protein
MASASLATSLSPNAPSKKFIWPNDLTTEAPVLNILIFKEFLLCLVPQ